MPPLKKQLQVWLTRCDEGVVSKLLREKISPITFLDDNVWKTGPAIRQDLPSCQSRFIYLWQPGLAETLPTRLRNDGQVEGPTSGVVVQYLRSELHGSTLESGRFAAGSQNPTAAYRAFVALVWRVLLEYCSSVDSVHPTTRVVISPSFGDMLVGKDAAKMCNEGRLWLLKYKSTENYFLPSHF